MLPVVRSLVLETPGTAADSSRLTEKGAKIGANEQRRYQLQAGDWGIADSQLRPAGKARFGEHYVDVVADGLFVEKGRPIRIIEVSGNRVVVREIESEA
jgi:membrane-bound ClpP family serine protease